MRRIVIPPTGTVYDGAPVVSLSLAPDGRWYVARQGARTVLAHADEFPGVELGTDRFHLCTY